MKLDWSKFTPELFNELKKIIVDSRLDNNFTVGKIGIVLMDDVPVELFINEAADDEFDILYKCKIQTHPDEITGKIRYHSDMYYDDFQDILRRRLERDTQNK